VHGLYVNWGDMMAHTGSNASSVPGPFGQYYGAAQVAVAAMSNSAFATKYPSSAFVIKAAITKTHTDWAKTLLRGIGCNWMVCMAVWLSFAATDAFGKCFVIWFCITLFISIGFEHLVVNMFLIPAGQLIGAPVSIGAQLIGRNLVPVTLGNILGALCLAVPFWVVHGQTYLLQKEADAASAEGAPGDSMHYGQAIALEELTRKPNWWVRSFGGDSHRGGSANVNNNMYDGAAAVAAPVHSADGEDGAAKA
jgi:hypothetical protein